MLARCFMLFALCLTATARADEEVKTAQPVLPTETALREALFTRTFNGESFGRDTHDIFHWDSTRHLLTEPSAVAPFIGEAARTQDLQAVPWHAWHRVDSQLLRLRRAPDARQPAHHPGPRTRQDHCMAVSPARVAGTHLRLCEVIGCHQRRPSRA
jgi:hypothetical protein